jgi:DNA-directed RNA polymerase subunit RPC12/RpoP
MNRRACPECGKKISLIKLLIMGPNKVYKCSGCNADITVCQNRNRVLVYGGLAFVVPAAIFCVVEPGFKSNLILVLIQLVILTIVMATAKVQNAK